MSELTNEDAELIQDAATLRAKMREAREAILAHQRGETILEEAQYKTYLRQQISIMLQLNQSTAGPKKRTASPTPRARSSKTAPIPNLSLDDL